MSLTELLGNVGLFGLAVMGCLAVLSIFSVGVILDKYRRFRAATRQWQLFRSAEPEGTGWPLPAAERSPFTFRVTILIDI
jgi:hypothetical protein